MIVKLGNTYYNTEANLSEIKFKEVYKGKLDIDIDLAWKLVSKYYKPPTRRKKKED